MRPRRARTGLIRVRPLLTLGADVVVPLAPYYGSRLVGANAVQALLASAGFSLVVVVVGLVLRRRPDRTVLAALGLVMLGTAIGLIVDDPRAMMVKGSWLTAVVGIWLLATLFTDRPMLYTATLRLMPSEEAADWRKQWDRSPAFRRLLTGMTCAFASAFLLDAASRVVMAYTLALDLVPVLSNVLLVCMLSAVVVIGRARAARTGNGRPARSSSTVR